MKRFGRTALAAATVALCSAAAALAGGPTTVSASYSYAVGSLTVPGVTTGLVLETGQSVTVAATGTVCAGLACVGPDGTSSWNTNVSSFGGFVLPGAPAWGLVGRVGSGPWVQVGSGPTTLAGTGAVQFAVNDDLFGDNRGSFTVTVTLSYTCWPGWGHGDKNHDHCGPPGLANKPTATGAPAAAVGETSRPGHGNGDENHEHSRPRGRS